MSLRARMIVAVTLITLVTLWAAFAVVSVVVTRSQEQHLDRALLRAARDEVAGVARIPLATRAIDDRPPIAVNDAGPLTPYVAIVNAGGVIRAATAGFAPSDLGWSTRPLESCFDFRHGTDHLRGVLTDIPTQEGSRLLFAVSRADLDGDAAFLQKAMEIVFAVAVAWTVVVATWIVRRLTRNQRRMAEVVRRVADGDLSARVGAAPPAPTAVRSDDEQLARDIDDMIVRLSGLLSAQRVFMAHAAHELRSPLTALYGELALALRRSRSAGEYRDAISAALDSTRQLRGLTEDLLAVARLGASPPPTTEAVDVREAMEEAQHMVLTAAPESGVRIEIVGPPLHARGAVRDIVRLFRNLLENALRHSPPNGNVRATISEHGGTVSVTIRDQGTGIPEPDRDLIFAPFYRGTNVPTASGVEVGLGLTIARGIARAYGGDVVVDAPDEGGAGFRVTLTAAPESIESQPLDRPARSAAGER